MAITRLISFRLCVNICLFSLPPSSCLRQVVFVSYSCNSHFIFILFLLSLFYCFLCCLPSPCLFSSMFNVFCFYYTPAIWLALFLWPPCFSGLFFLSRTQPPLGTCHTLVPSSYYLFLSLQLIYAYFIFSYFILILFYLLFPFFM
jgi:hypothetical protein